MKEYQTIDSGISVEVGRKTAISYNRVVNFEIKMKDGTLIEGILPANQELSITNNGDIAGVKFITYDIEKSPKLVQ